MVDHSFGGIIPKQVFDRNQLKLFNVACVYFSARGHGGKKVGRTSGAGGEVLGRLASGPATSLDRRVSTGNPERAVGSPSVVPRVGGQRVTTR